MRPDKPQTMSLEPLEMCDEYDEDEDEFLDEYDEEDGEEETVHSRSRSTKTPRNLTQRRLRAKLMKQYWDTVRRRAGRVPRSLFPTGKPKTPSWKSQFEDLRRQSAESESPSAWPHGKEIIYILKLADEYRSDQASIEIHAREAKKAGGNRLHKSDGFISSSLPTR